MYLGKTSKLIFETIADIIAYQLYQLIFFMSRPWSASMERSSGRTYHVRNTECETQLDCVSSALADLSDMNARTAILGNAHFRFSKKLLHATLFSCQVKKRGQKDLKTFSHYIIQNEQQGDYRR
jgi:hypothetical protein